MPCQRERALASIPCHLIFGMIAITVKQLFGMFGQIDSNPVEIEKTRVSAVTEKEENAQEK